MKKKERQETAPVELNDTVLDAVSGGIEISTVGDSQIKLGKNVKEWTKAKRDSNSALAAGIAGRVGGDTGKNG